MSERVKSAVLLAAGRGTRQRPFTDETPKPLLAVDGRATLDYVLCAVARAGVERVCLVTHHLEEKIFAFVEDGSRWKVQVTFTHQTHLRGSGDALMSVPRAWAGDQPLMVLATDYLLEEPVLAEFVEAHYKQAADISLSLKGCPVEELIARSSVEIDSSWRIHRIIEKPSREEILSPYAASMQFIFPPAIWAYLPKITPSPRGEIELQTAIQMMIQDGFRTFGLLQPTPKEWRPELQNIDTGSSPFPGTYAT